MRENLPGDFEEVMIYGMMGYVVPLNIYPPGYPANPGQPLPVACLAAQKNYLSLYHMGLYGIPELLKWFQKEYPKYSNTRLDMGKSCIRFKKPEDIPYVLIGELCRRISVKEWIRICENSQRSKRNSG